MSDGEAFEPSLMGAVRRDRFRFGCIVTAFILLGIGYALTRPVQYTATASVILQHPTDQTGNADPPERFVSNQAAVITSSNVAREATRLDHLGPNPVNLTKREYLAQSGIGFSAKDSNLVKVSLTSSSARVAVGGADKLIQAYRNVARSTAERNNANLLADNDQRQADVSAQLATVQTRLQNATPQGAVALNNLEVRLLDQRNTLITDRATINVQIEQQARPIAFYSPATTASKTSVLGGMRNVVLAGVLGAIIAGALAYFRAVRRPVFFDAKEPEEFLDAPLLAELPDIRRGSGASLLPVVEEPESPAAKGFVFGAAALEIQRSSSGGGRFLLTSASASTGQSIATANLGLACAKGGLRTLVMDADLESQGVTGLLDDEIDPRPGWLDVVMNRAALDDVVVRIATGQLGFEMALLSPGDSVPYGGTFLTGDQALPHLKRLFAEIGQAYDIVLIDGPPILQHAYAATLASCADGVVVSVSHGRPMADQPEVLRRLQLVGRAPVGYFYTHLDSRRRSQSRSRPAGSSKLQVPGTLSGRRGRSRQQARHSAGKQEPAQLR